jgi:hypothetical protein
MKKLVKKLLPLSFALLPVFSSLDVNAQKGFRLLRDSIPFEQVPEKFRGYQQRKDIDTISIDNSYDFYTDILSQIISLDIDKDSLIDVREFIAMKPSQKKGEIYEKSPGPWKYYFVDEEFNNGKFEVFYRIWYDYFINGIDGTESSENVLRNYDREESFKKINDPVNPRSWPKIYFPNRKVDI